MHAIPPLQDSVCTVLSSVKCIATVSLYQVSKIKMLNRLRLPCDYISLLTRVRLIGLQNRKNKPHINSVQSVINTS